MVTKRRRRRRPPTAYERCLYCGAEIRSATVLVGKPEREVVLRIDRWPHPDGEVIRRETDDRFRMLRPGRRAHEGVQAYRVHSREACAAIVATG